METNPADDMTDESTGNSPAQPWEVGLLTAIRDMQWRYARQRAEPELLAALDGRPEAAGDFAAAHDDRVLFVELKRDRAGCTAKRERKKCSFQGYGKLIDSLRTSDGAAAHEMVWLSTRAHLFAYWVNLPSTRPTLFEPGVVAFSAYPLEVARYRNSERAGSGLEALNSYSLATKAERDWRPRAAASFERIFDSTVRVAKGELNNAVVSDLSQVGIAEHEVESFAELLMTMHGKDDAPFACIALSPTGGWIRVISNLRGLLELSRQMREKRVAVAHAMPSDIEEKGNWAPATHPNISDPSPASKPKSGPR